MQNPIQQTDPITYKLIQGEIQRQASGMELIASENYQSPAVLHAQSSLFANKYAEGFPWRRYYGGQDYTDPLEQTAIDRAKALFGCDHANVQALSGAAANNAVYAGLMEPGDTILGMDLTHGGHLTHGAPVTLLAKVYNFIRYKTTPDGAIDYAQIKQLAHQHKPKVILAGFSAYPREIDYSIIADIAAQVGAVAFADLSHIGGLIAGQALANPFDHGFQAMMTTTHKSLRGPRGALILSQGKVSSPLKKPADTIENIPTRLDRAVFPGTQGGPHMNSIAGIAVALHEASQPDYQAYAQTVLDNAQIMAEQFLTLGYDLVTGGTDNHMVVVDFTQKPYKGKEAEKALEKIGISTSKSTIPDDPQPPYKPSGLRIGMQAMTTRGFKKDEVKQTINFIHQALTHMDDDTYLTQLQKQVTELCLQFPLP